VEVNPSNDWAVGSRVCCDEKAIGTSLSPLQLLPNNTYYWRMRAIYTGGTAGAWNAWCGNDVPACAEGVPPLGFEKTFDAVTPTIPNLHIRDSVADATPATGESGLPTTDVPVVAWLPVPGASSYELKIAPWEPSSGGFCNWTSLDGRTFTTAATAWTPLAKGSLSPVGNTHPGVTDQLWFLDAGRSYCVRARARSDRDAKNAEIVSDWTQIGGLGHAAFTYEPPSLPACGATSMPASAYHDEPSKTIAAQRMPLFTWDRVSGACGYYIVIAKDPDFTKVIDVAFTTVPAYSPRTASGPVTYPDETTSYYWAVMPSAAGDGDGVSTQPQEDHPQPFNKRSVPPTLLSPKTGVTGEPSFRWTATEGAREYRIQVDDDPNFGTPITDVVTNSTAYTSLNKYPPNADLHWRVRANDETGVGLAWSDVAIFRALPPETYITAGPIMDGSTVSFSFASDLPDASFTCKLDGPGTHHGTASACTSPISYPSLVDGTYTFTVAAADLAGNADPTPESLQFTVDTAAPDTSISSRPDVATRSRTASFSFAATQAGSQFECRLDGPAETTGAWTPCTSPSQYDDLADGGYTFSVRATDPAGNTDPTPATAGFGVDTQPPETFISSGPNPTAHPATIASFVFAAAQADSDFECRLEGPGRAADWEACDSPSDYSDLRAGTYQFSVRATDPAGNTDPTPAEWTFALTTPPSQDTPGEPFPTVFSPIEPAYPAASGLLPAAPAPAAHRLGTPTFVRPARPVRVRRGAARLRFTCADPDGCAAATFVLRSSKPRRRPLFTLTVRVAPSARGNHVVTVRLSRAARRALKRAGRRGLTVTMQRAGARPARPFKLVR
jgi:hypothetical protein